MFVSSKLCFCKERLSTETIFFFFNFYKKYKRRQDLFRGRYKSEKKVFFKKNIQI